MSSNMVKSLIVLVCVIFLMGGIMWVNTPDEKSVSDMNVSMETSFVSVGGYSEDERMADEYVVPELEIILASAVEEEPNVSSDCTPWVNCNHNSPNFNGVCCRICYRPDLGHREWECYKVSDDIGFTDEQTQSFNRMSLEREGT